MRKKWRYSQDNLSRELLWVGELFLRVCRIATWMWQLYTCSCDTTSLQSYVSPLMTLSEERPESLVLLFTPPAPLIKFVDFKCKITSNFHLLHNTCIGKQTSALLLARMALIKTVVTLIRYPFMTLTYYDFHSPTGDR